MSRSKRILNMDDEAEPDPEECVFYVHYTENMQQITLTVKSGKSITPVEYMQALQTFINDTHEFPEKLFVEDSDEAEIDPGLH